MANVLIKEPVIPSLVENTTMVKGILNGVHKQYEITPNAGYVLHNNVRDWIERNDETGEEILRYGYSESGSSVPANYDFNENPNEIYAVPADSVPSEQIF